MIRHQLCELSEKEQRYWRRLARERLTNVKLHRSCHRLLAPEAAHELWGDVEDDYAPFTRVAKWSELDRCKDFFGLANLFGEGSEAVCDQCRIHDERKSKRRYLGKLWDIDDGQLYLNKLFFC